MKLNFENLTELHLKVCKVRGRPLRTSAKKRREGLVNADRGFITATINSTPLT